MKAPLHYLPGPLLIALSLLGCQNAPAPDPVPAARVATSPSPEPPPAPSPPPPEPEPIAVALPEAPDPPSLPSPLPVPGFKEASHLGPLVADQSQWPRPVVIVLHGNFDRPEWECDVWTHASFYGWLLCPRGVRSPGATLAQDRWTYPSRPLTVEETHAALDALDARYPGRVSREGTVLAGFSLGAIHAPEIAITHPGRYPYLFLVEGGVDKLTPQRLRALKKAGVRGIGLAMSMPGRRRQAQRAIKAIRKLDMKAVFVDMEGAGHNYSADFHKRGREALAELVKTDEHP